MPLVRVALDCLLGLRQVGVAEDWDRSCCLGPAEHVGPDRDSLEDNDRHVVPRQCKFAAGCLPLAGQGLDLQLKGAVFAGCHSPPDG